jgi:phosphate/sulfate permease
MRDNTSIRALWILASIPCSWVISPLLGMVIPLYTGSLCAFRVAMATALTPGMLHVPQSQENIQTLSFPAARAPLEGNTVDHAFGSGLVPPSNEINDVSIALQALDKASSLFQWLSLDFDELFDDGSLVVIDNGEKLHFNVLSARLLGC